VPRSPRASVVRAVIVHVVDGTYELFRHFYGQRRFNKGKDKPYGAVAGVLHTVLEMLETGATHIGVATDHVIESFRNQLWPGYKTGEGIEPALWNQFPLAERAARALGIVTWSMIDFEADDALATAATRAAALPEVSEVYILSPDKDLMQCVSGQRIMSVDRIRKKRTDEAGVVEKFGVGPASVPDWLALVGDTADGIPGIARWGPKSAGTVLAAYGHLEAIPDQASAWTCKVRGADALAATLAAARPEALLYRTLATLRRDVPLAESTQDLRWRGVDRPALEILCKELGDLSFLQRVG
jgi:5'-3' exonuclease